MFKLGRTSDICICLLDISEYGATKNIKSIWTETSLDSPTLNIEPCFDALDRERLVFEGKIYDDKYFTTNDSTICQPVIEGNQQTYQWGFSVLQLEISLCLLTLWTFGIYAMLISAHLRLASMGTPYNTLGNLKAAMSLTDAVVKDFNEQHGKDIKSLTGREVMSYTRTKLNGGRVMLQPQPLVPSQSARKVIWNWVMANKTWTVAFTFVSLSLVYFTMTFLIWLTMVFSMVAGWGRKTRNFALLLSVMTGGLLPAGYLVVMLCRKGKSTASKPNS